MTLDTSFPLILYIKSIPLSHLLFLEYMSQVSAPLSISTACSWSKPPSFLTWTTAVAFLPLFNHATHSPFCSQRGISGDANLTWSAQSLQPCLALNDPVDCSPPSSSVHGISLVRILEWVGIFSSRGSSWPRYQNCVSWGSCIGRWILYYWVTGETQSYMKSSA